MGSAIQRYMILLIRRLTHYILLSISSLTLLGCQALFHAQDAPFRSQPVTVALTIKETPPPAVAPMRLPDEPVKAEAKPKRTVQKHLLPTEDSVQQLPALLTPTPDPKNTEPTVRTVHSPREVLELAETVLKDKTLRQDMVLKGTVLVTGVLKVPRQMTLRIEPGTVIHFAGATDKQAAASLEVAGRLVAQGTQQAPVVFTGAYRTPFAGDWGGIHFVNSKKKNLMTFCQISAAHQAMSLSASTLTMKGGSIGHSREGVLVTDSTMVISHGVQVHHVERAIAMQRGTLIVHGAVLRDNRLGLQADQSSLTLQQVVVLRNAQEGVQLTDSRFTLEQVRIAENRTGLSVQGGSGQVRESRFVTNRQDGLAAKDAQIRILESLFAENQGLGVFLTRVHGQINRSVLRHNQGGALHAITSSQVDASGNYWGFREAPQVAKQISGDVPDKPAVRYEPFAVSEPISLEQ